MGWLIALGIIAAVALFPVGVRFRYDAQGIYLAALIGKIKIPILPSKKKHKKKEKKKKQPQKTSDAPKTEPPPAPKSKKGGSVRDFLPLVRIALDFLNDFRKKIRVDQMTLKVTLAGDDPYDLAENYGKACAAMGNFLPQIERVLKIRKREVNIACDFCASETTILAALDITITIGRFLLLVVRYGLRAVSVLLKKNKIKKASVEK